MESNQALINPMCTSCGTSHNYGMCPYQPIGTITNYNSGNLNSNPLVYSTPTLELRWKIDKDGKVLQQAHMLSTGEKEWKDINIEECY